MLNTLNQLLFDLLLIISSSNIELDINKDCITTRISIRLYNPSIELLSTIKDILNGNYTIEYCNNQVIIRTYLQD